MSDYGLVLSSDGSKSSFEIGAWKALRELDIDIIGVSGSFVGALNAALIAQGDFERAVRFWRNVATKDLFGVNKIIAQKYTEEWSKSDTKTFKKSFLKYIQCQTEELAPLKEILDIYIDEKAIRHSGTRLGFVSVSLSTLEAEMLTLEKIPRGKLTTYLLAASCFPQISQVNRAQDPQFSATYSPYKIIAGYGINQILSTDDLLIVPPDVDSAVTVIRSSEAMVLDLCESAEKMKRNIKLGYIDTLKLFQKSLGTIYFIQEHHPSEQLAIFKKNIGKTFGNHFDLLLKLLLRSSNISKDTVEIRAKQMLQSAGVKYDDLYIALIENAAKILLIGKDEKYTFDRLITSISGTMSQLISDNKAKLADTIYIKNLIRNASFEGKNIPSPNVFAQYFLLLISCKPSAYEKFLPFINSLHTKTILAIATILYLMY